MLDPPSPAHVGDVNQTVDPGLDLDEGAEGSQVADLTTDACARRILLGQVQPRIFFRLLHAQGNLLLVAIDLQHHGFDLIGDRDELRRMPDVPRPAHLRDMDEALDTAFQFDERTVVRDRHDLATHSCADRILLLDILPRMRLELLEAERDPLAIPVDVEDLDLDLIAHIANLARVPDPAPRHVGDVQQSVHAAEIDERAKVRDVLDDTLAQLPDLELFLQLIPLLAPFLLQDHAARDHDIAAALVQLEDLEVEFLADQLVDVRHASQRDLRAR